MKNQYFIPYKNDDGDLTVIHWSFDSKEQFKEIVNHKRENEKQYDFKTDRICRVIDEDGAHDEWLSNLMSE